MDPAPRIRPLRFATVQENLSSSIVAEVRDKLAPLLARPFANLVDGAAAGAAERGPAARSRGRGAVVPSPYTASMVEGGLRAML
ncbi:MAG: hypothetical protein FJ399_11000 [Verrucomicrobia bacterium]|nr:hypothetical protein [Verrucomicrobiota bacterium]